MKAKYIFSGLLALTLVSSCSDNMDYNETNIKDRDYIIQTFGQVGGLMTEIYNHLDYDYGQSYGGAMLASATDESVFSQTGGSIETFYNGSWSPTNSQGSLWSDMYDGIRTCNEVLKTSKSSPSTLISTMPTIPSRCSAIRTINGRPVSAVPISISISSDSMAVYPSSTWT